MIEQEGHGVREDFAQESACQMPEVARPNLLYRIALRELAENGVYPIAKPTEEGAPFGIWVSLLGGVRSQKLRTDARQLLPGLRRMVVAIPDDETGGALGEFGNDRELMGVGRGHRDAGDDAWPADPRVHPEAVEGLFEERVLAEGGLSLKTPTAVGSGEQTRRQGHRVDEGEGGVVRSASHKLLPKALFDLPQVGCLAAEGGAVHPQEVREEVGVVAPEVRKELCILVYPQELTDNLDSDDLGVEERGSGSACSEASEVSDTVVYEAEDGYDEGAKIHRKRPPSLRLVWSPPSVERSRFLFNCPEKLAHGVS